MRGLVVLLGGALLVTALATSTSADLAEPGPNEGATDVRIDGTKVTAEAWAVALGHDVDTIVVTRLLQRQDKPAKVESYERWSVDGKKKFERGSRALGRAWEKHLWAILDAASEGKKRVRRKRGELLDRVMDRLGRRGERAVDGYAMSWTVSKGLLEKGGRRSRARIAVFTFTPTAPGPASTPRPDKPKTTTPGSKSKTGKPAPLAEKRARKGPTPVTPAPKPEKPFPFPFPKPGRGGSGGSYASGSGLGEVRVDSEKGVREHARVTVDLGRLLPPPTKKPVAPKGPVTPKQR